MFFVDGISKSGAGRPTFASAMMLLIPPLMFEKEPRPAGARFTSPPRPRKKISCL
jgi:hypothetical protein